MLSELRYGAFLSYNPPRSQASDQGKFVSVRDSIKRGGSVVASGESLSIYRHGARRIQDEMAGGRAEMLFEFLPGDALVVPVPRSAPLPEGAFWPAKEFCTELVEAGLTHQTLPLLERAYAVPKSSFARRGERPKPSTHFASLQIASRLAGDFERIIVVDDIVTKGATLLASASRLHERFPNAEIRGFALLRTKSFTPCGETPLDPFFGVIRYDHRNDEANREDR